MVFVSVNILGTRRYIRICTYRLLLIKTARFNLLTIKALAPLQQLSKKWLNGKRFSSSDGSGDVRIRLV